MQISNDQDEIISLHYLIKVICMKTPFYMSQNRAKATSSPRAGSSHGSSETIRKTTFNFQTFNQHLPQHIKHIDPEFLEWFIGFAEGDGSFIVSHKDIERNGTGPVLGAKAQTCKACGSGRVLWTSRSCRPEPAGAAVHVPERLMFFLTQKEVQVLHMIRSTLGFGKVFSHGGQYFRYSVTDKESIDRLIYLFNGNLLLNKTNKRFHDWVQARNILTTEPIRPLQPSKKLQEILLSSAWLSGFIDAEGCFNIVKTSEKRYSLGFRIRCRFILGQLDEKSIFVDLEKLLGGYISARPLVDKSIVDSGPAAKPSGLRALQVRKTRGSFGPGIAPTEPSCVLLACPKGHLFYRYTCTSIKDLNNLKSYLQRYRLKSRKRLACASMYRMLFYIENRKVIPWEGKVLNRILNLCKKVD